MTLGARDVPVSARLVAPDPRIRGRSLTRCVTTNGRGCTANWDWGELASPAGFLRWIDGVREAGILGAASIERDRVPHQIMWWVTGDQYLGRVRINLRLNDELTVFGGHIGYDIKPSARRRGHGTALLGAALRIACGLGIDHALLTCAPDNHASRRVIERNGGIHHDLRSAGRLRYWCPTGRPTPT